MASAESVLDIDISSIDSRTHLFFDDKHQFIAAVNDAITAAGIPLIAMHCPPGQVELYDESGSKIEIPNIKKYSLKKGLAAKGLFRDFLWSITEPAIGNGITIPMIQQIIDFETNSSNPKVRVYFFDFDMLLSQIEAISFAFGDRKVEGDISRLIPDYAKYIFSDYIREEPANGRLTLLKRMFREIGPERVYIVTSNNIANAQIVNKKTQALDTNPYKRYFLELIRELLPSFAEDHLICTYSKNIPPLFNNKGDAIVQILTHLRSRSSLGMGGFSHRSQSIGKVRRMSKKKYGIRKLSRRLKMK
jgi:hypothetical protein